MNSLLVVNDQSQDSELDFWRIIVPENPEIKEHIARELHSTPYSAHPGIQRTIARMRRSFYWKGMLGDVMQFVENCPVCQMENLTTLQLKESRSPLRFQKQNGVKPPLILLRTYLLQLTIKIPY